MEDEVIETVEISDDDLAAFDEDWGDGSDSASDAGASSEQPDEAGSENNDEAAQSEETEETTEEQGKENEEGNQLYTIKYLGNEEKLTLDQLTELAQKGRNYDHLKAEHDKLKGERSAGNTRHEDFLADLAKKSGLSVEEQIDRTRAAWLVNEELEKGNEISEADALLRVQRERAEAEEPKAEEEQTDEAPERFNPQIDRFLSVYPTVQANDIPQEVWDEANRLGGDLLGAYQAYEIKRLKADAEKQTQTDHNEKNKNRSTGSRQSAGTNRAKDSFDEGWNSD